MNTIHDLKERCTGHFLSVSIDGLASSPAIARSAHAAGSDEIKIALIGCGGRGSGAAVKPLLDGTYACAAPGVTAAT